MWVDQQQQQQQQGCCQTCTGVRCMGRSEKGAGGLIRNMDQIPWGPKPDTQNASERARQGARAGDLQGPEASVGLEDDNHGCW